MRQGPFLIAQEIGKVEGGRSHLLHTYQKQISGSFQDSGPSPKQLLHMLVYRIHWGDRSEGYEALISDLDQDTVAEFYNAHPEDYLLDEVSPT